MFKIIVHVFILSQILFATTNQKSEINIGILSFRDVDENNQKWQPLEILLEKYLENSNVTLHSFHQKDLDYLIAQKKFDFVILHPQAFVEMETKYGIQNIASLVRKGKDGHLYTSYAGTIITLKDSKIQTLSDIKGKRIAIANKEGQAIYLMPKDVLYKSGIDIDKDCKIVVTGQPLLKSYEALKNKKADVAFLRSGYLEELIDKGLVKHDDIKIINQLHTKDFNYIHSTPLYPEWSFAAIDQVNHTLIKAVTKALYSINDANSSEFDSFSTPLSYKSTRELMHKHHIYPFDSKPTIKEFLDANFQIISIGFILFTLLSWYLIFVFFNSSKKMALQAKQIKDILATASDGIHIHDKKGNIILFSDSFHQMLGYTREEMNKLTVYDIDTFIDPEKIKFSMNNLEEGKPFKLETKHLRKDGVSMDVEIIAKLIKIDNKQFIYASSRDLTEVRANEKILKLQNQELEAIFNTTKDGLAILDRETNFMQVNSSYSLITGLTKDELLQTSCINLTLDSEKEMAKKSFEDLLRYGYIEDFEKTCVIKEKKIIVSMSMSILPDNKILVAIKDISKKKLFEEQSKLASMGEMIGNIAHQWRQPLTVISTIASGIQFRNEYNQLANYNLDGAMENIMKQTQYLSKTIDDFRNFIKNTHEQKYLSIKNTIDKTISIISPAMKNHNIQLIINCTEDIEISGYENELMQSFINILNNARDAIRENIINDDDKLIFITTTKTEEGLSLAIKDSGGGIPDTIIEKIFEPYFTTKHQSIGTGIGLSMTYKILTEHHKATIDVHNEEYQYNEKYYKGAVFTIEFQ